MTADLAAVAAGTPGRIEGRQEVATFFRGSAHAAMAVFADDRPAAAWYHRGRAAVLFDFAVVDGVVAHITFRAEPEALAGVERRDGASRRKGPQTGHNPTAPDVIPVEDDHHDQEEH